MSPSLVSKIKPSEGLSSLPIGNIRFEKWGYKINNKYGMPKEYQMPDLNIEFEDGKLNGVNQE
jgi:hypothetical protein